MALQRNEPVFLSEADEQKYRQLQANFRDACLRIHELSEFVLKLKETQYRAMPSLAVISNGPEYEDFYRVTKSDYELLNKLKKLINEFDL